MLIVMSTQGHEVTVGDLEARRMLEESGKPSRMHYGAGVV